MSAMVCWQELRAHLVYWRLQFRLQPVRGEGRSHLNHFQAPSINFSFARDSGDRAIEGEMYVS